MQHAPLSRKFEHRARRARALGIAVVFALALDFIAFIAFVEFTEIVRGSVRAAPYDVVVTNASAQPLEVAPLGHWTEGSHAPPDAGADLVGFTRLSIWRGYWRQRMRVFDVAPGDRLELVCDGEEWRVAAVLVRSNGGVWREYEHWMRLPDVDLEYGPPLVDVASLPMADRAHASFVDEQRGTWYATPFSALVLAPLLFVARFAMRAIARRRGSTPPPWNWRLELALAPWLSIVAFFTVLAVATWT